MNPRRWLGPLVVAFATVAMFVWTRDTWADCLYDFGSQLYYPWRMTAGDRLYTDIAFFNGPLSQYWNALLFKLFGVGLRTLEIANAAVLALVLSVIYRIVAALGGALPATVAALVVVLVFAFSQYVGLANYNWMCPYTHEVTHGVALAIGAVAAVGRFMKTGRRRWLVVGGFALGLAALTKAEVFAPAALASAIGVLLGRRPVAPSPDTPGEGPGEGDFSGMEDERRTPNAEHRTSNENRPHPGPLPEYRERGPDWRLRVRHMSILAGSAIVPIVFALAALSHQLGQAVALRAVAGSWPWVFDRRIAQLAFYRQGLGIDDVAGNIRRMLWMAAGYLCVIGWVVLAARSRRMVGVAMIAVLVGVSLIGWSRVPWESVARPWPIGVAGIALLGARYRADPRWRLRTMWAVLSLGLLGKMLLNARIGQYGFALAMPAAVLVVDALLVLLPAAVARGGGDAAVARAGGAILIATTVAVHLWWCGYFIREDQVVVGTGADALLAPSRGLPVEAARQAIDATPPGTLAVMPQGLMLNYLTRRVNLSPLVNLMPPEMMSSAPGRAVQLLQRRPPDQIIVVQSDWSRSAFHLTEGDLLYGQDVVQWVRRNYRPAARFGRPGEPGLLLLLRREN